MRRLFALVLTGLAWPIAALAHGDGAHRPAGTEHGWSLEPMAAALLGLSVVIFLFGYRRMSPRQRSAIAPRWRIGCYAFAVACLVAALFSPLDARADSSFAWHMAQHLLLMLVAAPLLAMANVHLVALFALPLVPRRFVAKSVNRTPGVKAGGSNRLAPFLAAAAFAAGLWLWHAPKLYEQALLEPQLHTLEHLTFLITAAIFWRMVSTSGDRRLDPATAIVLVTLVALQGNLLAALITLSPEPIYWTYSTQPLSDQQIAGLLMWVPAGVVYLASSILAIVRLVNSGKTGGRIAERPSIRTQVQGSKARSAKAASLKQR